MKKIFLMSLGVLVFGVATASANSDPDGFRFDCRFLGSGAKGFNKCEVKARVCEFKRDHHDTLNQEECRDALFVECNGQVLFRGFATHHSKHDFEFIKGDTSMQNPTAPILKYESDRHHQGYFTISAWLLLDGNVLNGFCSVRAPKFD